MVTLELKNGTILQLNLKDKDREKSLRDAWYSMSDMPQMLNKELKIRSDRGSEYLLKVGEILNCEFSLATLDHKLPEKRKKTAPPARKYENSSTPMPVVPDIIGNEDAEEEPFSPEIPDDPTSFMDIMRKIMDVATEIIESMPQAYKENLTFFLEGLHDKGVNFIITDQKCLEIASAAMKASSLAEIEQYVQKYLHYIEHKK
jgi:hypothetical protein